MNLRNFGPTTPLMPTLFIGHGNPMNAIENNAFSKTWQQLGQTLPKPRAILCISAHWETQGTAITAMPTPKTIHDFYGFPEPLSTFQYPAPGDPALATTIQASMTQHIHLDHAWGLDHGAWSLLTHLYNAADIPVLQLSLDKHKSPQDHYHLAKELAFLRTQGVLIIGSGNVVHNLRAADWQDATAQFDWAKEANHQIQTLIESGNHDSLANYAKLGPELRHAIPTPEHFLPLLYILALQSPQDPTFFFNNDLVMGSISMLSVGFNTPEGYL
ncbi:MAG: 4,5-DOPA dioxygenase extradiol [Candidatus Margulisiibacteriota bacterium]